MDTTYIMLQNYWWLIISVLGALLVLLLFVQGGQSMLVCYRDEAQKTMLVNSMGRKWEFTFTTLVTFGGAFFASFPLFYSTSFGGAYWLWMLILFSFVIQAVSYEYRSKSGNVYGARFFETLLFINGVVGPVLLGVAVGGIFFGADFTVTKTNILGFQPSTISQWGPLHGLEAIADWRCLALGIMVLFLARTLASLYFINNIDDAEIARSQRKHLLWNAGIFVVLFLACVAVLLISPGVEYNDQGVAQWVDYKYLNNYLTMWWCLLILLVGVVLVLAGIGLTLFKPDFRKGIWFAGLGTVLVVLTLFWVAGYNNTAYYPSVRDVQSSLTLRNSSSSPFTLTAMSYVSILVPFVLAYIVYCWRAMDLHKLTKKEVEEGGHLY